MDVVHAPEKVCNNSGVNLRLGVVHCALRLLLLRGQERLVEAGITADQIQAYRCFAGQIMQLLQHGDCVVLRHTALVDGQVALLADQMECIQQGAIIHVVHKIRVGQHVKGSQPCDIPADGGAIQKLDHVFHGLAGCGDADVRMGQGKGLSLLAVAVKGR